LPTPRSSKLFLSHQFQVLDIDIGEMDLSEIEAKDLEKFFFYRADITQNGKCDEVVQTSIAKFRLV
jgi:hypothetical protein